MFPHDIPHSQNTELEVPFRQKLPYYMPCFSWLPSYTPTALLHDTLAGVSLAAYQIPLAMSFATAVAHVPAICGLLGLSVAPAVYCLLGTVPQMIVGPEAAVSMIVGQTIEKVVKHNDGVSPVDILVVLTSTSGAVLFAFGLLRFGFIDNVLCGSLLKGFITAIGLSMMVNSIIAVLGLQSVLDSLPSDIHVHSVFQKLVFLFHHWRQYNGATLIVGGVTFSVLVIAKRVKKLFVEKKYKKASFFPEILVVVVISTILSSHFEFNKLGIKVLGKVDVDGFQLRLPFSGDLKPWYGQLFVTSFMCAILGFFESSTAGKSLGSSLDVATSSNRELVALGSIGLVISSLGALPSFGGYARSKLNSINGANTPISGLIMGITTLFVTFFMLDYMYYLPICVLNAVICIVGVSLIQETPKEIKFHWRTKGYNELVTFVVTLSTSLFYSIETGVALGCFYSVIRVIKHSTKSRIQILSRVAGTGTFISSDCDMDEWDPDHLSHEITVKGYKEFRTQNGDDAHRSSVNSSSSGGAHVGTPNLLDKEGCLIVKIPEPLTFTNTSDLKTRLKRLELTGSAKVHPAGSKKENSRVRHVVFDLNGMTSIDSSAAQILFEIIDGYQSRGINVFFCRVFKSIKLAQRLKDSGIMELLLDCEGEDFGIKQSVSPYYDEILDALKAIDGIESSCDMWDNTSYYSNYVFDGV
ncbi:hypothetical protein CANARDRAFT_195144 [[Candida] arabinofermentans NRRL YB-2248]|uniref:STAS domain-containing protein n=1 Tax=[Candida] arabinofermentans NRRL YB-2248 TaxID=983967 RepID=A0A1E4T6X7_9ASCO|nr:hypothetical protein CANARDRAFT_195144 [[Candida] arabinofermentans NRRL YB-2248]